MVEVSHYQISVWIQKVMKVSTPEMAIVAGIIDQAMKDSFKPFFAFGESESLSSQTEKIKRKLLKRDDSAIKFFQRSKKKSIMELQSDSARRFLTDDNIEFDYMCTLLDINSGMLRKQMKLLLNKVETHEQGIWRFCREVDRGRDRPFNLELFEDCVVK